MSETLSKHSDASSCSCSDADHHSHPKESESCCGGQSNGSDDQHTRHAHKEADPCHSSGSACGCSGNPVFDGVDKRYKAVLWAVIALNAGMFFVEMIAGHLAGSQALQADALDFLGDSLTYGISLAVIGMSLRIRSTAALVKGFSLLGMGLWIFGSTLYQAIFLTVPRAEVMGVISIMALAANVGSVMLLSRYKDGDANVRSVWLCSRNDAIGNVAVMAASVCVYFTTSAIPDIAVALVMAGLFLRSAQLILRQSSIEFRQSYAKPV